MQHVEKQSVEGKHSTKLAAGLLSQQIWCWGRDIEKSNDNLLIRYGFHRIECPPGIKAASMYQLDLSPSSRIALRGFGVFYGDDRWGGLFLPRFEFTPQLTPESVLSRALWSTEDLPSLNFPHPHQAHCCQQLLLSLISWMRDYELWVGECTESNYRSETLIEWQPKFGPVVRGEEMAAAWQELATDVREHAARFIRTVATCSDEVIN